MMHCRQASRLLSEAQDRDLSRSERFSLVFHLSMCRHCRNFSRQLRVMRSVSHAWRDGLDK